MMIKKEIKGLSPILKSENRTFVDVRFVLKVPSLRHDQDYLNYGLTARLPIRPFQNAEPYRRSLYLVTIKFYFFEIFSVKKTLKPKSSV